MTEPAEEPVGIEPPAPEPEPEPAAAEPPRRCREPPSSADAVDLDSHKLYLNRELSLLSFQERVLEEAEDPENPLLERVKFLSIFSSNLAEFYMVRIAGLKQQVQAGVRDLSADGMTPGEQLTIVRESARQLIMRGRSLYGVLRAELCENGIYVLGYDELDEHQRSRRRPLLRRRRVPGPHAARLRSGAPVPAHL